jgi:hypothetical protein
VELNYITQHYDNSRTGWNPHETILTTNNVRSPQFRKLFEHSVDGDVYAQPLYVQNVHIIVNDVDKGIHNVVFVATENDSVYAFDADSNVGPNAQPLWARITGTSSSLIPQGEITVPATDAEPNGARDIFPVIGITSTPVIDRTTNTLYLVAKTKRPGANPQFFQRIHALDLESGQDKHIPVENTGAAQGGTIAFNPLRHLNRPGLLLNNDKLYICFSSHADVQPYYGWVFAYEAGIPGSTTFLTQLGVFNAAPEQNITDAVGPGIWMSGFGPACDENGFLYFLTGNGPFNANTGGRNYGDSVVKLSSDLIVVDYFEPFNQALLKGEDADLGSGGVVVLPDQSGHHRHTLTCCGKEGTIYLIDRDNMGKFEGIVNKVTLPHSSVVSPGMSRDGLSVIIFLWS